MSASRDLLRIISGVLLVAKEFAKLSQPKNGDLGTLISSSVKKAVVSATDLAGITSGKVYQFSPPRPKQSVVYFPDSPEITTANHAGSVRDLENSKENVEITVLKADLEENNGVSFRDLESLRENNAGNDHAPENLWEVDEGKEPDSVKIAENDQRNSNGLANSRESKGATVRPIKKRKPRERRVPSTPFTRSLGFAGLGAGLAWGTIQESAKRLVFGRPKLQDGQSALSPFLSEQNAERLALALCRMRGAALKLGQMLSIQDETLIPAPTDPNWSNFLYDESTRMINLIDFGAAREYPQSFVDDYLKMVLVCADRDRDGVIEMSQRLGFLTGMESEIMLDAHVQAGFIVGLPFSRAGGFDFRSTNITQSISNLGATMLKHRLTPPPDEAYSLHWKLSGAFLACIKLGAVLPCRDLFFQVYEQYQSSDDGTKILASSAS